MSKKEQRIKLVDEMNRTLEEFCDGCFLYSTNRKERGRTYAHQFCLTHCTVGQKLKEVGFKMNNV